MCRAALVGSVCLAICLSGCSSGEKELKLAAVDGTISYEGKPVPNATVVLLPEKGPIATAMTDKEGKFRLVTGGKYGAVIGNAKVTVTAASSKGGVPSELSKQPKTPEESAAYMKKAAEMQQAMASGQTDVIPKSLIPEKYGKEDTTPLSYPIKADGNNHFKIEL